MMTSKDDDSLKRKLKNNVFFNKLDFDVNKHHDTFDNVVGLASNGKNDFVIGPENCTKDEIVTLISKSLDLDAVEFEKVERILSCLILNIKKYHMCDESDCDSDNPYKKIIRIVKSSLPTLEKTNTECKDCKTLKSVHKIASARTIHTYEKNENHKISYDEKRMATISLSYYYSMMIGNSIENWRIAVFPAYLIFELFVYRTACEVFSDKLVSYQETRDYLESTPFGSIRIRPDVLIKDISGKDKLILDAKYKRLSKSRCYNDVHQMSTYVGCLGKTGGTLVYPSFLNREINHYISDENGRIGFLMLDVMHYRESYIRIILSLQPEFDR